MRPASLEPYKSETSPNRPWCVDIPPVLSDTGRRKRKFFATKREAQTECEKLEARRDNFGFSLTAMTPARIAEAAECYKLLESSSVSLTDAVRGFLEDHKQRSASLPFGQLFDLYLEAKAKRSEPYKVQLRWAKERFSALHDRLASDITVRDLDELLKGEKPTVKNAFMRYLRAVMNWGLKRDYLSDNPIAKMDFEEVTKGDTDIFEPKIIQAILDDCLSNDLSLLPYRVIGFFCGVRPDGELPRLHWSDIDTTDKVLKLRAEITKKRRLRFVDLPDNAFAWLEAYKRSGGSVEGPVVPFAENELRDHHRKNWLRVVGADTEGKPKRKWIQQGMRHSFCSYWLAENEDIDRLVIQSGHESKEVMWRNYYRATTKAKAKEFWSIQPKI
jgi:integrase